MRYARGEPPPEPGLAIRRLLVHPTTRRGQSQVGPIPRPDRRLPRASTPRANLTSQRCRGESPWPPEPRSRRARERGDPVHVQVHSILPRRDLTPCIAEARRRYSGGVARSRRFSRHSMCAGAEGSARPPGNRPRPERQGSGRRPLCYRFTTDSPPTSPRLRLLFLPIPPGGRRRTASARPKPILRGETPQVRKRHAPERAAAFSFWLYSAVWTWDLTTVGTARSWIPTPWHPAKTTASFDDALATLRTMLWRHRIFGTSGPAPLNPDVSALLIDILARAA